MLRMEISALHKWDAEKGAFMIFKRAWRKMEVDGCGGWGGGGEMGLLMVWGRGIAMHMLVDYVEYVED